MPDEVSVLSSVGRALPDLQKARGSNQASVKVGEAHPAYSPIESVDTFLKLCLATLALADRVWITWGKTSQKCCGRYGFLSRTARAGEV
jgi:hypothetical protein